MIESTRQVGKKLEKWVADYLKEFDSKSRPTRNSGASTELGDILHTRFRCECKKRNTENITLKKKVWDKLCGEITIGSLKIPLYILQNKHNDTFAVLDFKDFIELVRKHEKET